MKKQILVFVLALCMLFSFGLIAQAEETGDVVLDHADCGVEGTDWEAVTDSEDYVPATCEEDGLDRKHCSVCGVYVEETVLPKLGGHDVQVDEAVEPTCTETGLTEGKSCHNLITLADGTTVKCDYVEVAQEEVPALGHDMENLVPVDPDWRPENYDCEEGFSTPAKCPVCEEELKLDIFVTFEHQPEVLEAVEPTCTATGLTEGSQCSVCGKILVEQEVIEMLEHTWVFVPATAGSCTEDAVSYHQECSVCGEKDKDYTVLHAPGHKEEAIPAVEPTCTETGLTEGKICTVCGETTVEQEEVKALGHDWKTVLGTPATCEENGVAAHRACQRCDVVEFNGSEFEGEKAIEAITIPAHGHIDVDGWERVAVGRPAKRREGDESKLVETNPELNKTVSCLEDGYASAWHCPWCGEERKAAVITPALGHDWKITKTGEVPTCTEWGISDEWTCQNEGCGLVMGWEDIKPLGHDVADVDAVAATCLEDGNIAFSYCKRCGLAVVANDDFFTNPGVPSEFNVKLNADGTLAEMPAEAIIPAFEHGYAAPYVNEDGTSPVVEAINPVAPTCYSTGLGEGGLVCTLCDEVVVPAPALDMVPHIGICVPAHDATCTADGNLEFWYCRNEGCTAGNIIVDGEWADELVIEKTEDNKLEAYPEAVVLPKLGHDPKPGTGKAPTCTEEGWTDGEYCYRCGITLVEQETIDALGHTEEIIEAVEPTCTETGLTEGKKCSVCDAIIAAQEEIPANGHTYNEYVAAVEPTCTEDGHTQGLRCSKCTPDYAESEGWLIKPQTIDKLGHDWHYAENLNAEATCTAEGYDEYNVCDRCEAETGAILPMKEHDWIAFDEQKPTCTEYGVISARTCRDCGYTQPQQKVDPLGHNPVVIDAVAPTCTETGLTEGKECDRCGLVFVAQEEVPATGHNMIHVDAKEPTCTEDGNKEGQKCANEGCDHKIGCETITKLDHTPTGIWVVEVKPTYGPEGQGLEVMYCDVCKHKIDARMIPALEAGLKGDANNDGAVNIIDVLVILQYDARIITDIHEFNADYDNDGVVTVLDAMALLYAV